jgi:tRNA nucleotidyltransferase (CCA-adding enzyme)
MTETELRLAIPERFVPGIEKICATLEKNGYQCHLVGGAIRDLILDRPADDYDFATDARPEALLKLFRSAIPTGIKHGTVSVILGGETFEITTYRSDGDYGDGRHPDAVSFSDSLEVDISRRDFTMNGLAYDYRRGVIIDHCGGMKDIRSGLIRTIGSPDERFAEDGLRPYRACRFASKLGFTIHSETFAAITGALDTASRVSAERVRDEFVKTLQSPKPSVGLEYMRKSGLMKLFLPELDACHGVQQNKFHSFDVYWHCLLSCDGATADNLIVRLAALLHDIAKPIVKRPGDDGDATFYNHEVVGARMTKSIMKRLKFSNVEIERTCNLVVNHMFHYTDEWNDGAVRRFMRKVGVENLGDLSALRMADRAGNGSRTGVPAPITELFRRVDSIIEAANAITVRDLKIGGHEIMSMFGVSPGPIIGKILNELLEMVLDDPDANTPEILSEKAKEIFAREQSSRQG